MGTNGKQATKTVSARERLEALSPERQSKLLDPAEAEFVAHGFEHASLNRILVAAGMSKGQGYYYFSDKADLYRAVIERGLRRLMEAMAVSDLSPRTADEFWAQIADVFARMAIVLQRDEPLAMLARGIYEGPGAQAALAEPLGRIRLQLDQLIILGQSVGAVRTDLPQSLLAEVLFGVAREIDRWFAAHWPELSEEEALRFNEKSIEMIVAMASPRASD